MRPVHPRTRRTPRSAIRTLLAALAALALALFGIIPATAAAAAASETSSGETYTIATDTTFAPFEFRDANGELTGIDIDIMEAIAEDQGFTVEFQSLGFNAALQAVQSGQADGVIAGMGITDERAEIFDFSEPYFTGTLTLATTEANAEEITGWEGLEGKTLAVKTGSLSEEEARANQDEYGFEITALDQTTTMVESVKAGTADALMDDYPIIAYGVEQGSGLVTVGDQIPTGDYGFAVNKGDNAELMEKFDAGLAALQESGEYEEIVGEYLGDTDIAGATGGGSEPMGDGQTYTIATDTTFAPFEFRDANGELTGIDIDIMEAIAEKQNFQVEWQSLGFNAALQAVQSGQADGVIAGMGITDERAEIFDFSEPYFTGTLTLATTEANAEEITGWEGLEGKTLAVKTGSLSEEEARANQEEYGFEITALDQTTTMVESVKAGTADALMDDYPIIAYGVEQGSGLVTIGEEIPTGDYGFAVNKGDNAELLEMFDVGLADLKSSGEYDEIVGEYLGSVEEEDGVDPNSFWGLIVTTLPALMSGLGNTLLVTGISFALAMVLGLAFGFMKIARNPILRGIAVTFISVFRGTPILVWAFFFYFGLPPLIGVPVDIWVAGVLTLTLNGAAYIAEIVRGGVQSVDPGQMEASRSLGLGYGKSMQRVVLPQAFKIMTPSLINQLVIMLKDSSLLLAIGFAELLYQAQQIYAANFRVTEVLLITAVIYFVAITALTQLANYVDRKVNA